jgi:O-antigen/teichoic acid export membrane protein
MSSLQTRYAAKLCSNIVGLLAGLVVVLVVPRALGPASYGTAEFLLAFFTSAIGILDVGTSNGYYAWLSRRPQDAGLVRGYLIFAVGAGVAVFTFVLLAFAAAKPAQWLWPQVLPSSVLAGCLAAWLIWMQQLAQKTIDARALTTTGELWILLCRSAGAVVLVVAAIGQALTFRTYLTYLMALPLITTLLLARALRREEMIGGKMWSAVRNAVPDWRGLLRDFRPYVVPMLLLAVFSASSTLADRWMLQHFGGAVQQGLYSLGNRIVALCFVFTGAMAQLLTREFAMAWERGEKETIGQVFSRYVPPLYAISTAIAVFVAWHAGEIVGLFGGHSFADGASAMVILAFYPMHQTLGQLSSAVYYGTATMRLYARIQIGGIVLGLPMLWLLVTPHNLGGLDLGSVGLALKMVLSQMVSVNVLLYFIARNYGINFGKELRFQLLPPLVCVPMAVVSGWSAGIFFGSGLSGLLVAVVLYGAFGISLIWFAPWAFGLRSGDIQHFRTLMSWSRWRGA